MLIYLIIAALAVVQSLFGIGLLGFLLRRNLLIWGLGGVIAPFVGIKLIDLALVAMHMA